MIELFRGTMHQDAQEFLNYLLNTVAEDVIKHEKKLLKLNEIKVMDNIPRYPEIDLFDIWESVKQNANMRVLFPDNSLRQRKLPN